METPSPVVWLENPRAAETHSSESVARYMPATSTTEARKYHLQMPGYRMTPLKGLTRLANMLGIGGIWVKDEAERFGLGSFKVLGGSFAIFRYIRDRLGNPTPFSHADLARDEVRKILKGLTFAAATDGNHGRGVAWAARQLGTESVIYVHERTSPSRIHAIEEAGARVVVVPGTYDDAVRQVSKDATENHWQVISDTSWPGYEDIPAWVMQGYATLFLEVQQQMVALGDLRPTHVFVQAGVGSLAAAAAAFYANLYRNARPKIVVVEPERAACLYASLEANDGQPRSFPGDLDTIMAGLACGDPNPIAWQILRDTADIFLKCPDYVAGKGMRVLGMPLAGDPTVISGESGAVTLGALMFVLRREEYRPLRERLGLNHNSQVLLVNTERNTDPDHFRQVVWDGAASVPVAYRESYL
ncbi:MAG TPA: diaminopropionate ammonia-lyase [Polyangiaceae bacterium]|nr:MAG: Diaminopropionate ammonia-lyase [Deltaproteobacteria bacterium ADurb.Bin207]HNS95369.1 diaminopropionate ammonia-lyase [Polyangiaceae bacterium]HNZ23205.1 diaminopropionate ammonia-lyase [Polyangiaceae bacterium]HOD24471.1 diaminopropionate ammonia-lyase [Polyangiaceae bacterium]HOE49759.1 diaminopropionate ammonia-lyase [Polyangiaceae bacterium]